MAQNENVQIKGLTSDNATLLLAAAEELELPASVVRVDNFAGAYVVPAEVAEKAGLGQDDKPTAKKAAAKKTAAAKDKE